MQTDIFSVLSPQSINMIHPSNPFHMITLYITSHIIFIFYKISLFHFIKLYIQSSDYLLRYNQYASTCFLWHCWLQNRPAHDWRKDQSHGYFSGNPWSLFVRNSPWQHLWTNDSHLLGLIMAFRSPLPDGQKQRTENLWGQETHDPLQNRAARPKHKERILLVDD